MSIRRKYQFIRTPVKKLEGKLEDSQVVRVVEVFAFSLVSLRADMAYSAAGGIGGSLLCREVGEAVGKGGMGKVKSWNDLHFLYMADKDIPSRW